MGAPAAVVTEIPADFLPLLVREDDRLVCYGHRGIAVQLGFDITGDPVTDAIMAEHLRAAIWWHVEMVKRGVNPDTGGMA